MLPSLSTSSASTSCTRRSCVLPRRYFRFAVSKPGDGRTISAFREKPKDAKPLADAPDQVYASMGNYVFTTEALVEAVTTDAADEESKHDIGGNIIPMLVARGEANVYDFAANDVPGATDR